MLRQVADGVLVHESEFLQSQAVVVQGGAGVLLIDPGVQERELACLADDLARAGHTAVAGFSTHPHWDHLLWHARFGEPPRYGTARCAAAAREQASDPEAKAEIIAHLEPTGIAEHMSLDLFGLVTGLPDGTAHLPWDGPRIRIVEHQAHAPGHAALLVEDRGVLIAGDMLSDVLIPMLGLSETADPIDDYLTALQLLEDAAADADVIIPGHGAVGGPGQARARIAQDRAYVLALRSGHVDSDPRIGPSASPGWEWVTDVHTGQLQSVAAQPPQGDSR